MFQDLRFGFRLIRRNPGFSLLVILCMTVGIGATTSVLGWIEGILLRPFPLVAHQDRMVALTGTDRNGRTDVSWPDLQDLRRNCSLVDSFIAEHIGGATLAIGDRAERATGSVVSSNYFEALGVHAILGRTFDPSEDVGRNAHPVTVISYDSWTNRYKSDPSIIGKTQMLNGVRHTIIGVTPEGFYGTFVGYSFQFWVPASMEETFEGGGYKLDNRDARWSEGFAILKPGVTIAQAQAEISAIAHRLESTYPDTNRNRGFQVYPLWATPFNQAGTLLPTLRISLVVATFVLLIACANVANLLLFRALGRRREITVRLSLGVTRSRLLTQLLTEGLILTVLSTLGGLLLAHWSRSLIKLLFPPTAAGVVIHLPAEMDWRVLALSAAVCLVVTVLFGLIPALQVGKIDLASAMRSESGGVVGTRSKASVRSCLVLAQVALSFILLVGSGLLLKSLQTMREADLGFSTNDVLAGSVDMVSAGYDPARIRAFQDQIVERMQALPGVDSVAWARTVPFTYRVYASAAIAIDGFVTEPGEQPTVDYNEVGPGFLSTTGIPLVAGREFTFADNETALPVAVVNQTMVDRFWRGESPVGRRLQVKGRWLQIVGVARNSKYSVLLETAKPFFYVPLRQGMGGQNILIHTRLGTDAIANALVREIKAIDRNLAPGEVITMREQVSRRTWTQRAAVTLLAIFSGIALLLAGIGLYGVMSYSVSQSTRELGLRMALGADMAGLLRIVFARGLILASLGIGAGVLLALGLTRLMGDMLYKTNPRDPAPFVWAFVVMMAASCAAILVPAWRAAGTDPVRALRDECR
ncbi:MAG TPA: ABC transporter permease [Bryobacteraceae bacterium]|nr:ABC transporter permease [Bryobacteraceae bacterium]